MSTVVMTTASGEAHGLIGRLSNSVVFDDFKHMDPKTKTECEKQKKDDARMVKVKYLNKRGVHERLTKPYCRWAGDPILQYNLIPGREYEIPYGMVKEVNGSKMPKRSGLISVDGKDVNSGAPLDKDTEEESLHMLVPVNFY